MSKLLVYTEVETWEVNADTCRWIYDGVSFSETFVLEENKEKYESLYNPINVREANSEDMEFYNKCEWVTHPESSCQVTIDDYNIEKYYELHQELVV